MAEKAILKYCNWELNIDPPSDFIESIYNYMYLKYKNNDLIIEKINKIKDICETLLQFSLCEYKIYSSYNQIIISLSCYFICISHINDDEEKDECSKRDDIQNDLKDILDKITNSINIGKKIIEDCSSLILKCLENDEDINEKVEDENEIHKKEKEDNLDIKYQLEITRSESNDSNDFFFEVINNFNFEKNDDDISLKNESNYSFNFGAISPIYAGDIISLKEELENIDTINIEKTNKNKLKNKNNDDEEEFILLKRKRNEKII